MLRFNACVLSENSKTRRARDDDDSNDLTKRCWIKTKLRPIKFSCTAVRVMAFLGVFACHLAAPRLELLLPSVRGGT